MKLQNWENLITIDADVCNGKPVLRGKRITVQTILEFLSAGESREEIFKQYPSLTNEDIDASLEFASHFTLLSTSPIS